MKNIFIYIPIILIALLAMSCDDKECCSNQKEGTNSIEGTWLLFERVILQVQDISLSQ
jgi:hypothetical protein